MNLKGFGLVMALSATPDELCSDCGPDSTDTPYTNKTLDTQLRPHPADVPQPLAGNQADPMCTAQERPIKAVRWCGHRSRLSLLPAAFLMPQGGSCKFKGQAGGEHT